MTRREHLASVDVPDTKETRMAKHQRVWRELEQQHAGDTAKIDQGKGQELAEAEAEGFTQREMQEGFGIAKSYIEKLLRYYRFTCFVSQMATIVAIPPEGRFRDYWHSTKRLMGVKVPSPSQGRLPKDPEKARAALEARYAKRQAEEERIFLEIKRQVEQGNPPTKLGPPPKKAPVTKDQLSEANRQYRSNARKEVQRIITTIRPEVQEMLALCVNADHKLKWTPGLMKHHAEQLTNALKELDRLEQYFRTAR